MSLLDEDTGKIPVHTLESLLTDEPALDNTLIGSADQLRELLAQTAPEALEGVGPNPDPVPAAPASASEPGDLAGPYVFHSDFGATTTPQARQPPSPALAALPASQAPLGFRLRSAIPGGLSWSVWLVFGLLLGGGLSCGIGRLLRP
jgi:hypothetical protein